MKNFDIVIVGGGLSGLTAAVYLSKLGKKVAVIEKGKHLGGRASTKEILGSSYNLGPHAFYKKGEALRILREIGIAVEGGSPRLNGTIFFENLPYELPSTFISVLKTKLQSYKEKKEFIQLMLNLGTMEASKYNQQTLEQWAESTIKSKLNQQLFYTFCRLASYIHAPELVRADVVLRQLKLSLGGAIYVHRGWQSIIDKLEEQGRKLGVTFLKNSIVKEIDVISNIKQVLLTTKKGEAQTLMAKWIISTVSPKELLTTVKGIQQSKVSDVLTNCIAVRAACLDVTVNHLTDSTRHFSLDMNQSFYYSNHSHSSKLSYHPSNQIIHVMKYLRPEELAVAEQVLEDFLEKNQPGWKDYVVSKRYSPNLIVTHRIPTVGSADIMELALQEFPGLVLAGEWVSNHSLLAEGAIHSAKKAVEKING